ncbi:MAG TPA: NrsF family protein [Kofleriaceae bacterium]|nr:NrsF family protein [Kofleriaceae bacterium]
MSDDARRTELLDRIRAEPSPTRLQHRVRCLAAAALALAIMVAIFLAFGGVRPGGPPEHGQYLVRPIELMVATWIGAAALSLLAAWQLVGRGPSMLGRRLTWLAGLSALVVVSLVVWKLAVSSEFADMTRRWPHRVGLKCLLLSLALGGWPLAALVFARRRSDVIHPRATGAALGVVAGAATWLFIDLWCPVAYLPHLLLGHVLPIALFATAGASLGRRWIAIART